jgi:dihydrolipoamide dehydrogenase
MKYYYTKQRLISLIRVDKTMRKNLQKARNISNIMYDLIVIGGGTGGLRAALKASANGLKTLLIESSKALGGTCLNTGCIPTKVMLNSSGSFAKLAKLGSIGIKAKGSIDIIKVMNRAKWFVRHGQKEILNSVKKRDKLELVFGSPSFSSNSSVIVNNKEYTGRKIIIATGATNTEVKIPGIEKINVLTNINVNKLRSVPKNIVMIGGGYISLEFATFFSDLGSKVTVIEKMPEVLGSVDSDVREVLLEQFQKQGIQISTQADILKVTKSGQKKSVDLMIAGKSRKIICDEIFTAIGRVPNTNGLKLEKAGISLGQRGNIEVDDELRTTNKDVLAIGDVNGKGMFAHLARRQCDVVLDNILGKSNKKINHSLVPWAIFTTPTIAGIGITENEARKNGIDFGIMKAGFSRNGKAAIIDEEYGFAKIIYANKDRKIIGACIIGPDADIIIHEIIALINMNASIEDLKDIIHIHPTLNEVFVNLR